MTARPASLLVEDDDAFASELISALAARGLELDRASTWEEGLELFRVNGYELVIADYNLPDTEHGLKLLASMKSAMPSSHLVLISGALTPSAERRLQPLALLNDYLSKRDANLTARIAGLVEQASKRGLEPTDWQAVGVGFVADLNRDMPEFEKIDEILRADVERRE